MLPRNQPGARRVDDRRVISGIVHVLRVGCRWQDCPPGYGPSTTVYNRFNRWSHKGYDAGSLRARLAATKTAAVILSTRSRKTPIPDDTAAYDTAAYPTRNLIERAFCRRKDWRRIATRDDKLARNFESTIAIAAIILWRT